MLRVFRVCLGCLEIFVVRARRIKGLASGLGWDFFCCLVGLGKKFRDLHRKPYNTQTLPKTTIKSISMVMIVV